jgi:hypothetical protein
MHCEKGDFQMQTKIWRNFYVRAQAKTIESMECRVWRNERYDKVMDLPIRCRYAIFPTFSSVLYERKRKTKPDQTAWVLQTDYANNLVDYALLSLVSPTILRLQYLNSSE